MAVEELTGVHEAEPMSLKEYQEGLSEIEQID
jgi:hypothetical protein